MTLQAQSLYEKRQHFSFDLKAFEALLYLLPGCLLIALTWYVLAEKCVNKSAPGVLLLGCWVGASWAICVTMLGHGVAQLLGAPPLTWLRVVSAIILFGAILIPVAVSLCAFMRWHGRRFGDVRTPI